VNIVAFNKADVLNHRLEDDGAKRGGWKDPTASDWSEKGKKSLAIKKDGLYLLNRRRPR
jgi:hypothetical protein